MKQNEFSPEEMAELEAAQRRLRQRQADLDAPRESGPVALNNLVRLDSRRPGGAVLPPPPAWLQSRLAAVPQPRMGARGMEFWEPCVDCKAPGWHSRNEPALRIEPNGPRCPGCLERRRVERQAQERAGDIAEALATIPLRYRASRLDAPELRQRVLVPERIAEARAAVSFRQAKVVLLLGATGRGKTTLGTAIFCWHLERAMAPDATTEEKDWARRALWVSAQRLSVARRETKLGCTVDLVKRAREASILLIDDLGREAPADQADVAAVLEEREAEERPTIVTFGELLNDRGGKVDTGGKDMRSRYGAQMERRLTERKIVLDLGGGS